MRKLFNAGLLVIAVSLVLSACATYDFAKQPPQQSQPITVVYTHDGASGFNDLPLGVYRVPQSQVIVSGYRTASGAGVLFGLAGVLIEDAVVTQANKSALNGSQNALQFDITDDAQRISDSIVNSGQFENTFSTNSAVGASTLSVNPYIIISYVNDTEVRPYVVLKATLRGPTKNTLWSTRYITSSGKAVALAGDNSFTSNDASLLKAAISKDLELDIKSMLADVASPHVRDENKLMYAETAVPFMKQRVGFVGYELGADD